MSHMKTTKLLDMDIDELYALTQDKIAIILNDYYKEDLIAFAQKHEIPVKPYLSRVDTLRSLSKQIADIGQFRRIAGSANK